MQNLKMKDYGLWECLSSISGGLSEVSVTQEFLTHMMDLSAYQMTQGLEALSVEQVLTFTKTLKSTRKGNTVLYNVQLHQHREVYLPEEYYTIYSSLLGLGGISVLSYLTRHHFLYLEEGRLAQVSVRELMQELNASSAKVQGVLRLLGQYGFIEKYKAHKGVVANYTLLDTPRISPTIRLQMPPLARDMLLHVTGEVPQPFEVASLYTSFYYASLRNTYPRYISYYEERVLFRDAEIKQGYIKRVQYQVGVDKAKIYRWDLGKYTLYGYLEELRHLMFLEETNTFDKDKGVVRLTLELLQREKEHKPITLQEFFVNQQRAHYLPLKGLIEVIGRLSKTYNWNIQL